jgi:hypothetical protein
MDSLCNRVHVWSAVAVLLCVAPLSHAKDENSFGPWEAGNKREVTRQDQKGIPRAKYPMVGDPAKVPGEGPPPPALQPDPDVPETALQGVNRVSTGLSSNPLYLSALFYRHFLTKVDGPRCQHLPTCSRFANQAVARHGVLGIFMSLDRVIQPPESSSVRTLPQVEGWGPVRYLDPVGNYEFWKEENFLGFPPPTDENPLDLSSHPESSPSLARKHAADAKLPLKADLMRASGPCKPHQSGCERGSTTMQPVEMSPQRSPE